MPPPYHGLPSARLSAWLIPSPDILLRCLRPLFFSSPIQVSERLRSCRTPDLAAAAPTTRIAGATPPPPLMRSLPMAGALPPDGWRARSPRPARSLPAAGTHPPPRPTRSLLAAACQFSSPTGAVPSRCSPPLLHRWPAPAATAHPGGGRHPRPRSTSAWASMADLPNRRWITSPNSTTATPALPPISLLPHTANVLLPTTLIPFSLPWMHLVPLQLPVSTGAANKKKGPCDRASIFFHRGRRRPSAPRPPCQSPSSWPRPYSTSERARTSGSRPATSATASFRNPSGKNAKEKWSRSRRPQALSPLRGFLFSKHKLLLLEWPEGRCPTAWMLA